ncbi:uncharacterized protein [Macrobrachium rosenbergii]|uniref:uncharacterized protein n=1 Tax=Macrobrachium rosenbergii TaxID=79674 RepID=UPI0034D69473
MASDDEDGDDDLFLESEDEDILYINQAFSRLQRLAGREHAGRGERQAVLPRATGEPKDAKANATRLLSGTGRSLLEFTQQRYCAVLREDAPTSSGVTTVVASHKEDYLHQNLASLRWNRDGLFTIDQKSGLITLAAALDYELHDKHELVVSGEGGGQVVQTIVEVSVADVNDNPPVFTHTDPHVTVIEEDDRHLPTTLLKVEATDPDQSDESGLLYTLRGDGVDGYSSEDAFFKIYPHTGDLIQLRALDRDPPNGKRIWKLRVKVKDGQKAWKAGKRPKETKNTPVKSRDRSPPWDYGNEFQNDHPIGNNLGRDVDISTHTAQNHDVTKLSKNSGVKWDGSKVREDEIRGILWETKDNRYDRLVSLQSGGGKTKKHAWTRERNRKHKTKPFSWTNSNDKHAQHSWKFKEINHKDAKQLSWNDQYRFGILKSVYNYKNEENSHRNSWELSIRTKNEKSKDKWVSSDSTSRTEGRRTKLENTNQGRVLQVQGMKDQISLSKSRSEEFLVSSPDTSSSSGKGQTLELSKELSKPSLNSYAVVENQNSEPANKKGKIKKILAINNGGLPQNYDSSRFFQKATVPAKVKYLNATSLLTWKVQKKLDRTAICRGVTVLRQELNLVKRPNFIKLLSLQMIHLTTSFLVTNSRIPTIPERLVLNL